MFKMNALYRYFLVKLAKSLQFCRFKGLATSIYDYIDGKPDFDLSEKVTVFKNLQDRPPFCPYNYLYGEFYVNHELIDYVVEYNEEKSYVVQQIPECGSLYKNWGAVKYKQNIIYGRLLKLIRLNNGTVVEVRMEKL